MKLTDLHPKLAVKFSELWRVNRKLVHADHPLQIHGLRPDGSLHFV